MTSTASTGANVTIKTASGSSVAFSPAPFISISTSPLRNKNAFFGIRYNITLNGAIVADSPAPTVGDGPNSSEANLSDIITKQKDLTSLFNQNGTSLATLEVTPGGNNSAIVFKVRLDSISFEEGPYVQTCRYTINLLSEIESSSEDTTPDLLEDFNETWSFDIDGNHSYGDSGGTSPLSARSFVATRTITATGRNFPTRALIQSASDAKSAVVSDAAPYDKPAWMQAMSYINNYVYPETMTTVNTIQDMLIYNRSRLGTFINAYEEYNHARTSSIDKGAGTVTVTDSWVLAPANTDALENYDLSISTGLDSPYVKVSIQGSIKGLAPRTFSDDQFVANVAGSSPYGRAKKHYNTLSNNGSFGVGCAIYKRADNAVSETLNSQPLSVSIGTNERTGEITYNLEFDNRPTNYFSNVLYENISVNDTYPGDVFATIPVLGRPTGPILQFTFGRTEYKRDISIEILVDSTRLGYGTDRASLLLKKPSINDDIAGQLKNLISIFSPEQEPGIRKYFLSPPTESWNPKEGRYTLNLGWTYELSE
jgi:hypothetical protein